MNWSVTKLIRGTVLINQMAEFVITEVMTQTVHIPVHILTVQ